MNKNTITFGVAALSLGAILIVPTVDAFWGGEEGKGQEMSSERFTEMKQMFASYESVESFQEAMKTKHEERKAERDAMKEKISHEVTKTENGVVITVTSDDADIVEKIQENQERKGEQKHGAEDITRTVVEIENGLQITMTTTDADRLEQMHERADNGWEESQGNGEGKHQNMRRGKKGGQDGEQRGQRGGRGGNMTE